MPYSRVPILLAVGAVKQKALVEDGKVVAGYACMVNATFDHRIIDGFHAAIMSKELRKHLEHPYESFGAIPEAAASSGVDDETGPPSRPVGAIGVAPLTARENRGRCRP